jgi:hypothetical protein
VLVKLLIGRLNTPPTRHQRTATMDGVAAFKEFSRWQ